MIVTKKDREIMDDFENFLKKHKCEVAWTADGAFIQIKEKNIMTICSPYFKRTPKGVDRFIKP
jgi:hypothetical protein